EGRGLTQADGSFVIELPADLQEALQSQSWTFDVTIQSPTNQFVTGRTTVPVHKGAFYIGLSPREYVVNVGDESNVDLVAVTPDGDPYPGAEILATVYEYEWNSVYGRTADGSYHWETSVLRTPVVTTTVTSGRDGAALISWTPAKGGQYQVVARGTDDAGNVVNSATYLYVSDPQNSAVVAWPRENNDRIKLVADKQLYEPGETARILVPNPFSGEVKALLTLERSGVSEARVITLNGSSETIEIPITGDQIPNIFVGLVLVKGVDESNPLPAMRVGYVQLNVDTAQKELAIDIASSAQKVEPGDTVTYTLTVRDNAGAPVPDAEVSLAMVDKAVLSLAQGDTRSLLDIFYYQRPLGVTTGVLLAINQDRLSQQLSAGAKGGGGGGGGGLEIRQDFPDIAYWRADLMTDANGQIVVAVPLPDTLTTWSLAAKAVTTDTLVGDATFETVVSKDLQVRPLLPRFFTAGDRAKVGATVINTTGTALDDLHFTVEAAGATLTPPNTDVTATVAAGGQASFTFALAVDAESPSVVVTLTASSAQGPNGPLADAVRLEIPVLRYETPEVVGTAGGGPPPGGGGGGCAPPPAPRHAPGG
ncbi:MAG TPA: alpha-2-macroglobulin family protein, partial [Caldilineaceae bacterium]|nr:alpha-2-macroglobulin family protein [Caldilineaceae bacterium]